MGSGPAAMPTRTGGGRLPHHKKRQPPPSPLSRPPLPPPMAGASFHPDFMYCGACADCSGGGDESDNSKVGASLELVTPASSNSVTKGLTTPLAANTKDDMLVIETKLELCYNGSGNGVSNGSSMVSNQQTLLVESLLQPITGVRQASVVDGFVEQGQPKLTVSVLHDATCQTQDLLHVLKQGGFPATLVKHEVSDDDAFVNGHGADNDTAETRDLMEASRGHSEQQAAQSPPRSAATTSIVKSSFAVQNICCASEVPSIRKIVRPMDGVASLQISITTKRVYVQHDTNVVEASQIANRLTTQGFPATTLHDGRQQQHASSSSDAVSPSALLAGIKRGRFVESTLHITNLTARHLPLLGKAISQRYKTSVVRAIHPHVTSRTVKVEHDPSVASAEDVCNALAKLGLVATIITDGTQANLVLPASRSEDEGDDDETHQAALGADWQSTQLSLHVVLSGLFWVLAVIAVLLQWSPHLQLVAGLASVLFGLPPVAIKAWRTAKRLEFDANCMMVTAAIGALLLGEWDEAASVAFLFAISEFLEERATQKARTALATLCQLRPEHANVILDPEKPHEIVVVPADQVPIGSLLSIRTGDKVSADGVVVDGTSQLDESSLTGESVPVHKTVGDAVSGGGINIGSSPLVIRSTTSVDDSAVSRLIRLVEEAAATTSPTEKMIDGFARAYTPAVVLVATLLCTVPWFWGADVGRYWTLNGLIIIVIACPCALTISTPVTYAAGLAATAQRGIVVKGGASLESLGAVKTVLLDKTGTLTEGKFQILHMQEVGEADRRAMLEMLALMEAPSSHPVSATLVRAAKNEGVSIPKEVTVREHTMIQGEGVGGWIGEKRVYVGNVRLFDRIGMYSDLSDTTKELTKKWIGKGGSVGFIGVEGDGIIGTFCVTDTVRLESKEVVEALVDQGIEVHMLTGDGEGAAHSIADQIGLAGDKVHAKLLPEDKMQFVSSVKKNHLQQSCASDNKLPCGSYGLFRQNAQVLFCGDGVNDAPALAAADVGVSMGEGAASSLAMEMADVTLMDSNLFKLHYVIQVGSRVVKTIRENILLSLACKLLVVLLTFAGYMTLLFAIASDVGVMLLVTLNGMKLLPGGHSDHPHGAGVSGGLCSRMRHAYRQVSLLSTDPPASSIESTAVVDSPENGDGIV